MLRVCLGGGEIPPSLLLRVDSPQVPKIFPFPERLEEIRRRRERERREEEERREEQERDQLQQVMALSRQEYEEDSKLKEGEPTLDGECDHSHAFPSPSDTELAIALSIREARKPGPVAQESSSPAGSPYGPIDLSLLTLSLPYQSASQNSSSDPQWLPARPQEEVVAKDKEDVNLLRWRQTLISGWDDHSSSSSSSGDSEQQQNCVQETIEYGPMYGEEEDLATAIALSLAEHNPQQEEKVEHLGERDMCSAGVCVCVCVSVVACHLPTPTLMPGPVQWNNLDMEEEEEREARRWIFADPGHKPQLFHPPHD